MAKRGFILMKVQQVSYLLLLHRRRRHHRRRRRRRRRHRRRRHLSAKYIYIQYK